MIHGTGAIKSPKDKRDITLDRVIHDGMIATANIYPTEYETDLSMIPVRNQGGQPSCVAYAGGTIKEYFDYLEKNEYTHYSRRFLYSRAKKNDGIPHIDGTHPRVAWGQLRSVGICDESLVKDDITLERANYNNPIITNEILENAQPRIIKSYVAVTPLSFETLKKAIYDNKVVAILIALDNQFFHYKNGVLPLPKERLSGHEMVAYGYTENTIKFRNSHGEEWGIKGNGEFTKAYMPFLEEAHVFVDLPNDYVISLTKKISILQQLLELYKQLISLKK